MATIQWRPEVNALTTPPSYRILFVPRNVAGCEDLAADIARQHPNFSKADILTILNAEDEAIQARLLNGEQVTKSGAFSYSLTFSGKLNSPDDPLPPLDECLQVNVRVSPPFVEVIRQAGQTERRPEEKKLPLISKAEDTVLKLKDVLNSNGALHLTGSDLIFDQEDENCGCVLEGTRSGRRKQSRYTVVSNGGITFLPDIPAQTDPWNNEYKFSVSTRYSEHGTLRTGTYARMLRTPLVIEGFVPGQETGILTGSDDTAYVSVTGGTASGETTLRIQVILDLQADCLRFNLLDMTEGGATGATVVVTANGDITLQGFAGSPVTTLDIRVLEYAALKEMLRNTYNCRLVDVLIVT